MERTTQQTQETRRLRHRDCQVTRPLPVTSLDEGWETALPNTGWDPMAEVRLETPPPSGYFRSPKK